MEKTKNKNNIVVYTAICNNYDDLKDPEVISGNCDYFCFSDKPRISKVWKIINFPENNLDPIRKNRQVKILPHLFFSNYKYSIYVDGNIDIIGDIEELIDRYLTQKSPMAVYNHPKHNCIYKEGKRCIQKRKDNSEVIRQQLLKYRKEGLPVNHGLPQNRILIRKHNHSGVIKTMEHWWQEVVRHSKRDQISFNYCAWKNQLQYRIITEQFMGKNGFFKLRGHKKRDLKRIWQVIRKNRDKNRFYSLLYALTVFLIAKKNLKD